ncbi:MAG TPA: integrase core domain-containing protein [Niabella sp.]|nr:integrase core domain-containing protein [Niabella sp.]HRB07585.1 integrase core domain-containing protein [Niabella sp.]HRB42029.1 integrase core domain-containing protein [Niabella sp.]HRB74140.1 integrase core domain-containing protein [Niabella sp.]
MTQAGDPLENAVAEKIHRTIKEEFTTNRQIKFCNIDEARKEVKKFSEFYSKQRPHRSVTWLTPRQAHCSKIYIQKWLPDTATIFKAQYTSSHQLIPIHQDLPRT